MPPSVRVGLAALLLTMFSAPACKKNPPVDQASEAGAGAGAAAGADAGAAASAVGDAGSDVPNWDKYLIADFGKKYSCPEDRVAVKPRTDLDAADLLSSPREFDLGKPPDEVQRDPGRLAKWTVDREATFDSRKASYRRNTIFEVTGCGHTDFLGCKPYTVYKPGTVTTYSGAPVCTTARPPAVTFATLATAVMPTAWTPMAAPPTVGPDKPWDLGANLEWAKKIATAWMPDATLFKVELHGLAIDGTGDLTPGSKLEGKIFFFSPSKGSGNLELGIEVNPTLSGHKDDDAGTRLIGIEESPRNEGQPPRKPLPLPACSLPRAAAAIHADLAQADPQLGIDADLWTGAAGPVWRLTYQKVRKDGMLTNTTSSHRDINAGTCAVEHTK